MLYMMFVHVCTRVGPFLDLSFIFFFEISRNFLRKFLIDRTISGKGPYRPFPHFMSNVTQ